MFGELTIMTFAMTEKLRQELKNEINFDLIDQKDLRMRFRNSQDPIYSVFNLIDQQPLSVLIIEVAKDFIFDIKTAILSNTQKLINHFS